MTDQANLVGGSGSSGSEATMNIAGSGSIVTGSTLTVNMDADGNSYVPLINGQMAMIQAQSPSSYQYSIQWVGGPDQKAQLKRIGPKLYFRYVKNKVKTLSKRERDVIRAKVAKLNKILASAAHSDQVALYEAIASQLVPLARQLEISAAGYDKFIMRADVDRFINIVQDSGSDDGKKSGTVPAGQKVAYLRELSEFPRTIPPEIAKKVQEVKKRRLFDKLVVLYLDYKADQEVKSTERKIREKDPILFGQVEGSDALFYIADWVDEYCDLTFSKFVETVKESDISYDPKTIPEVDEAFVGKLLQDLRARKDALENTRMSNWREQAEKERARGISKGGKRGFWRRIIDAFKGDE